MFRNKSHQGIKSMVKAAELSFAVPQVIVHRTARMLAAGVSPSERDRREFSGMVSEKVEAFAESANAMGLELWMTQQAWAMSAMQKGWTLWMTPWSWGKAFSVTSQYRALLLAQQQLSTAMHKTIATGIGPIHKRATANARRLNQFL